MLIEGNPKAFVEAARRQRLARKLEKDDPSRAAQLYAQWGADYWVTRIRAPELGLAFADAGWFVYALKPHVQTAP